MIEYKLTEEDTVDFDHEKHTLDGGEAKEKGGALIELPKYAKTVIIIVETKNDEKIYS